MMPIDSFVISGGIHLLRIANRFAWYADKEGKRYGDFVDIDKSEVAKEIVLQTFYIITDHAIGSLFPDEPAAHWQRMKEAKLAIDNYFNSL